MGLYDVLRIIPPPTVIYISDAYRFFVNRNKKHALKMLNAFVNLLLFNKV
ncbi:hypothetical protein HMPREF9538_03247 [Klebsiella sp. MS 92-3]|nr:hypothetical protein HMPREF9538_03247 [Klebsiella sp. MS 92-3]